MMDTVTRILALVGGAGVVIIGLWTLFGKVLRDRLKEGHRRRTEGELEVMRQRYALRRVQADKFAVTQFDKYLELWETLQALRLTVDALWFKVTKQNLVMLSRQLHTTRQRIGDWSLFFEENQLQELEAILEVLGDFRAGKVRLSEIRSRAVIKPWSLDDIGNQIAENGEFRDRFGMLLEKLRLSFQERLSQLEEPSRR